MKTETSWHFWITFLGLGFTLGSLRTKFFRFRWVSIKAYLQFNSTEVVSKTLKLVVNRNWDVLSIRLIGTAQQNNVCGVDFTLDYTCFIIIQQSSSSAFKFQFWFQSKSKPKPMRKFVFGFVQIFCCTCVMQNLREPETCYQIIAFVVVGLYPVP